MRPLRPLLLALAALALGSPAAEAACSGADAQPSRGSLPAARHATLCLVNAERRQHGLRALREDAHLARAASGFSSAMVSEHFFDHVSPDGGTFVQRIRRAGYLIGVGSWALAENIAWGTGSLGTPRAIVASWMRSPGHRHNILDGGLRDVGTGVVAGVPARGVGGGSGGTYAQDFGRQG